MADFLHGVETILLTKGPVPVREVKSAVVFLVGTAPVHTTVPQGMSEEDWYEQVVNSPLLILSREDGAKYFGQPTPGYTIPYALDAIFDHGGTVIIAVNVFDPRVHKNASGQPDPSAVQPSDVIGSVSSTGRRTGLQLVDTLFSQFGFTAKLIIAPGFSTIPAVATEMIAKANLKSVRAMALIDAPVGYTVQQAINARGAGGILNYSDYRAVICYPHVKVWDTTTNTERLETLSARLAGVIARTDHEKGYWWSPSNQELQGIIGIERQITASVNDPNTEANQLNAAGIVTVFNNFGTGYRVWGNRSSAFPSKTDPLNFINIQRTADIIAESLEYYALQWLDKPVQVAIDGVLSGVNAFIRTLVGRGALVDGYCYFPKDKNPPSELASGHLTFAYHIMPPPPAERITFLEVIDIDLLKKVVGG
ncbi:MAG: phage tail sheath subtilisin-like domain-containing protein [Hydrogenobacter thermophilus]|uniref:phage tail sheath subtilisin-like domain-containing protein n=1 Tax=Hydrogenobacter thermophilus TaxID=940 RepID=UPI001C757684|nr:phage tail sheath subtilisin-like domain-containing protein [Hydrogenobacter thermophilus]QWK20458.1 MAG: phage tail sheath subtilisin-like domain-containing protein [Hydrogenobacter thermophilus]